MKAYITVGCSASGKSTFALSLAMQSDIVICERDVFREQITKELGHNINENLWKNWNWKLEKEVDKLVNDTINNAVESKTDIVISDTNLNVDRRLTLERKLKDLGYIVEKHIFGANLNLTELWNRDLNRKNSVGHSVIAKQYKEFRKQYPKYTLSDVSDKAKCVIFDIDGTLADMHNRTPFEWSKVGNDKYNDVLFTSLEALHDEGYAIIIMSGRDEVCRTETMNWLLNGFVNKEIQYELYMRKEKDQRKDSIIKAELFFIYVDGVYQVEAVFDDRPSVIRDVWMELGLKVYSCGNPHIEF